jgi:hypothetical protein
VHVAIRLSKRCSWRSIKYFGASIQVRRAGLWIVGAVGIELLFNFTKFRVFTVLPTASQN